MPRSKEDFQEVQEKRVTDILNSAIHLFALNGYDSVSIDNITEDAKCSHGLFYHYFNSKEDLFHSMMDYIKTKWEMNIDTIDFEQKPIFVIRDIISYHLSRLESSDDTAYIIFFFLTYAFQKKIPEPLNGKRPKKERLFYRIIDVIEKGQNDGTFEKGDPKEYATVFLSCLRGLAYNRIHLGAKEFKAPNQEILMNMFIRKDTKNA